jgi:hypothetical protein
VDLIPANSSHLWDANGIRVSPLPGIKPLAAPAQEAIAIDSLTLNHFHEICYWNLGRPRNLYSSASATANLNGIIACVSGDRPEDWVEIALLADTEVFLGYWRTPARATGEVMKGGWTRYYKFILAAW